MKVLLLAWSANGKNNYSYYPPIHQAYLAASLEAAGIETAIFDFCDDWSRYDEVVRRAADYRPDLVGFTTFTPHLALAHNVYTQVRKVLPQAAFVAGGGHATCSRERILEQFPGLDFAIAGEAERSLVQLARAIDGQGSLDDVGGLTWRRDGRVVHNERVAPACDLDAIPFPARHLLDEYYRKKMYWHIGAPGPVDMIITSRGCAFNCGFCFKVETACRFRSPENVFAELEAIRARGIRDIDVMDDSFTLKPARSKAVFDMIIEAKMGLRLKIRSRVNVITEEFLQQARRAGVHAIVFGIESGSQTMLDSMNKKTTVEQNRRALRMTRAAGIAPVADIMIGMPGETPETIAETEKFLAEEKPFMTSVPALYPLPETPVWKRAEAEGTLIGDWEIGSTRPWMKLPWTATKEDLTQHAYRMAGNLHRNPAWIWETTKYFLPRFRTRHYGYLARMAARQVIGKILPKKKAG